MAQSRYFARSHHAPGETHPVQKFVGALCWPDHELQPWYWDGRLGLILIDLIRFQGSDFHFDIARTENGRLTSFEERRETEGKCGEVLMLSSQKVSLHTVIYCMCTIVPLSTANLHKVGLSQEEPGFWSPRYARATDNCCPATGQTLAIDNTTHTTDHFKLSIYHFNSFHHFVFNKLVSSRNVILQMMCPNSRNTSGVGGCGSCAGPGARRDTSRRSDIRLGILSWHRCGFDLFFFGWYVLLFDVWLTGKNQPRAQRTKLLFKSNQQPSQH